MRALVGIALVVVVALLIAVMTGFLNLNASGGKLPAIKAEGGQLPSVGVKTGSVGVGTTNTSIPVPKVETKRETVKVPTIQVKRADER